METAKKLIVCLIVALILVLLSTLGIVNSYKIRLDNEILKSSTLEEAVDRLEERVHRLESAIPQSELEIINKEMEDIKIKDNGCADDSSVALKPVIYLYNYPERVLCDILGREIKGDNIWFEDSSLNVNVRLSIKDGKLTTTYPKYSEADGWNVTVFQDGRLLGMEDNLEYNYLYWDAELNADYDMSKGFCVRREDSAKFLRDALSKLGLTPKEYNEFIVFWLPKLEENPYNLITFQKDKYTNNAALKINPKPDNLLRVFMVYRGLDNPVEVVEQNLESLSDGFERKGFTVVEWGGSKYNDGDKIQ